MPHDAKIDARLSFLLSLPADDLDQLKKSETAELARLMTQFREATSRMAGLADPTAETRERFAEEIRGIEERVFAPLTTGFHRPGDAGADTRWREPHLSVFIVGDVTEGDLREAGVQVRSNVRDMFTAFVPLSRIRALAAMQAVRRVELARPLLPTVNTAVQRAQIDVLRASTPAVTDGSGTVVGILDSTLDLYHDNFRHSADNHSRVLYLWDQTLSKAVGEHTPRATPYAGGSPAPDYGVEYTKADIDAQLDAFALGNAYSLVRHNSTGELASHGTAVAGIAVGNGRVTHSDGVKYTGAAPAADIIFVAQPDLYTSGLLVDISQVADAFQYVFERATLLNKPCVVNLSHGDNLGPHDGTSVGERFLDALLETPGRAITVSSGNSTTTASHAHGYVPAGGSTTVVLHCSPNAQRADAVEIWYDGQDRFDVDITFPNGQHVAVAAGGDSGVVAVNGISVQVRSDLAEPNGDNVIHIIMSPPAAATLPVGNITIQLTGAAVMNGEFHAWVDRNNRPKVKFTTHVDEAGLTLGTPGTARRVITVGNHDASQPPGIFATSGRGPTRDGRVKPDIAAMGVNVVTTRSRNRNSAAATASYDVFNGTSASAPLVAGICACLFQCRTVNNQWPTWADLKQILQQTAGSAGLVVPDNGFGFGYAQVGTGCTMPAPGCDVWLMDHATDTGVEPFVGPVAWLSPDIEVLDMAGNPVANPTHSPGGGLSNLIRVTVRNRGTTTARNTEVFLYWADPATNLPYPSAWSATGIYTQTLNGFVLQSNQVVVPQLAAGSATTVDFAWAPPAPGANIRGDDHFCLLARLENPADPSQLAAGGWAAIGARNNIALRNVHVQSLARRRAQMRFYVQGSSDIDSLAVLSDLVSGEVSLALPLNVLRGPRSPGIGRPGAPSETIRLDAVQSRTLLGILHAKQTLIAGNIAIATAEGQHMRFTNVMLGAGERVVAGLIATEVSISPSHCQVHVAQRSGGQLAGGVTLRLV